MKCDLTVEFACVKCVGNLTRKAHVVDANEYLTKSSRKSRADLGVQFVHDA